VGDVEIGWAKPDDAQAVVDLLRSVASWLETDGPGRIWPPSSFQLEAIAGQIAAGEVVVLRTGGKIAASNTLQSRDPMFWPEDPPGEALYLHKLVVDRAYAGRGYGRMLLDWACAHARDAGCRYLRLDCIPRPRLVQVYLDSGFNKVGAEEKVGDFVVQRLQRAVTA
jgi:GNAT superfamily N-acetyltransferase